MKPLSLIEKAFFLKKLSLFKELDLDLLLPIADKMHQDEYDANEKVFSTQQTANRMYFIAKGSVSVFENGDKKLLKEGDFFGDEGLFNDSPRSYNATSVEDTLLLTLSRSDLVNIISECPEVAIVLLKHYAHQFPCRILT